MTPLGRRAPHLAKRPGDLGPVMVPVMIGASQASSGPFERDVLRVRLELGFQRHGGAIDFGERHLQRMTALRVATLTLINHRCGRGD